MVPREALTFSRSGPYFPARESGFEDFLLTRGKGLPSCRILLQPSLEVLHRKSELSLVADLRPDQVLGQLYVMIAWKLRILRTPLGEHVLHAPVLWYFDPPALVPFCARSSGTRWGCCLQGTSGSTSNGVSLDEGRA